ncbi:MAG TPA: hypothetical protein VF253_07000 [Candidatus Limnocylindrales bacterium]|jgi:hypothetical protein
MSIRRSILGLAAVAAFAASACAGTSASAIPSVEVPSVPASIGDLQGFCEDFASTLAADWPDIDQSTANELSSVVTEWSTTPGLDPVKADVQTIGTWLTTTAQSGAAASPPADVQTAFDNITAFADSNC